MLSITNHHISFCPNQRTRGQKRKRTSICEEEKIEVSINPPTTHFSTTVYLTHLPLIFRERDEGRQLVYVYTAISGLSTHSNTRRSPLIACVSIGTVAAGAQTEAVYSAEKAQSRWHADRVHHLQGTWRQWKPSEVGKLERRTAPSICARASVFDLGGL